ncbi:hypothetical protein [Capnocytophaga sputigena]|uniref:immunity protein TriTu family protein n=1 Tax=Capnocytophaga sputigena TaxID=1019 RepID=UPI0028E9ACC0|nr:hypothetical protein [Capnocytophaga sputigena]
MLQEFIQNIKTYRKIPITDEHIQYDVDKGSVEVTFQTNKTHLKRFTAYNSGNCTYEVFNIETQKTDVSKTTEFQTFNSLTSIFHRFYYADFSEISTFIDMLFAEGFERFKGREEIQGFDSGDFFQKEEEETMYFKYFQIVWKDAYLNERDMDLCDIEVSYKFLDNKKIKVWVELCGGADGIIYKEFSAEGCFEELKPQITAFVYECYNHYNKLIKEYIAFPITSNQ